MVSKVEEFNTVLLALDDNEVADILNALRYIGNDDLACEIEEEVFGECDCGDSSVADLKTSVDSTDLDEAEKKLEGIKELLDALAEGYK